MRRPRLLVPLVLLLLAGGVTAALYSWSRSDAGVYVEAVPPGDQEVAWVGSATNGSNWERFVVGVQQAAAQQASLGDSDPLRWQVDDSRAFPDQSTAVPEVVIRAEGAAGRLHIRWYKQTSSNRSAEWVRALAVRDPAPLAVIGGGTSDRAQELAVALRDQPAWRGEPPLLLLTTATANDVGSEVETDPNGSQALIQVYPGRCFRFCFTNEQMARTVFDFVAQATDLRPHGDFLTGPGGLGTHALALGSQGWDRLAPLLALPVPKPKVFSLEWEDDPYSIDLSDKFRKRIYEADQRGAAACWKIDLTCRVPYSVGGFYRPNPAEAEFAETLLAHIPREPGCRSVLVLPAVAAPARRVLRTLTGASPLLGRQLVAVTGDSIGINTVLRDSDLAWNVRSVPVPLVFFAHQNPVAWPEEPTTAAGWSGTDDVLLNADLVRLLVEAAYDPGPAGNQVLTGSADALAKGLRKEVPLFPSGVRGSFFDADGNRRSGTGEHIVYLRPHLRGEDPAEAQIRPEAMLEVWQEPEPPRWRLNKRIEVRYGSGPRFSIVPIP